MSHSHLFLGLRLSDHFQSQLALVNPDLAALFIGDNPAYLSRMSLPQGLFLGKKLGQQTDVETLKLAQENIYSLLKKLVPHYPYEETELVLLPITVTT